MAIWDPQNPQTFCDTVEAKGVRFFDMTCLRTPSGRILTSTRHNDGNIEEVLLDASFFDKNTTFETAYAEAMAAVEVAEGSIEVKASPIAAAWLVLTGKKRHLLLNIMNCDVPNAEILISSSHNNKHYYLRVVRSATQPFAI